MQRDGPAEPSSFPLVLGTLTFESSWLRMQDEAACRAAAAMREELRAEWLGPTEWDGIAPISIHLANADGRVIATLVGNPNEGGDYKTLSQLWTLCAQREH